MKGKTPIRDKGLFVLIILSMISFYQLYSFYYGVLLNKNRPYELFDLILIFPAVGIIYGAYSKHKHAWSFLYGYLVYLLVSGVYYILEGSKDYISYLSNFYTEYITFHWYDFEMMKSFSYSKGIIYTVLAILLVVLWNTHSVRKLFLTPKKHIVWAAVGGFLLGIVSRFI